MRWTNVRRSATRPSFTKADWGAYTTKLEEGLRGLPVWNETTSLKKAAEDFTRVIQSAAEVAIPRGGRPTPKPWVQSIRLPWRPPRRLQRL